MKLCRKLYRVKVSSLSSSASAMSFTPSFSTSPVYLISPSHYSMYVCSVYAMYGSVWQASFFV